MQMRGVEAAHTEPGCTACGEWDPKRYREHPLLGVPVCHNCWRTYHNGAFTMDDNNRNEVYCRWCGEGGMLNLCDSCPKAFCDPCIQRNLGLPEINRIHGLSERWSCFICVPQVIQDLAERIIPLYGDKFASKRMKKPLPPLPKHVVCADISNGREKFEIRVFNDVDDEVPPRFKYVTKYVGNFITNNPNFLSCCTCQDNCQVRPSPLPGRVMSRRARSVYTPAPRHTPRATRHTPHATRHTPHATRHTPHART